MQALVAALVLAAVASPLGPAAATVGASSTVIVTVSDARNDARVTQQQGPPTPIRRRIDVRQLEVSDRGKSVRLTVDVKRVDRSRRMTQIYIVHIATPDLRYGQLLVVSGNYDLGGTVHAAPAP
jgi:hypothetical protein